MFFIIIPLFLILIAIIAIVIIRKKVISYGIQSTKGLGIPGLMIFLSGMLLGVFVAQNYNIPRLTNLVKLN